MRTLLLHLLLLYASTLADAARSDPLSPAEADYSADFDPESAGGMVGGKFYSATDKVRIEVSANGRQEVVILRRDTQVGYLLMPDRREYRSFSLRSAQDSGAAGFIRLTLDGVPVKTQLVSGSGQQAERVTITLKNVVKGTPAPSLFEIPGNYRSIPSPGSVGMSGGSSVW